METSRLTAFVTWQRSVQLAAELLKLAQTAPGRTQRCLDDLADEALQRATARTSFRLQSSKPVSRFR